ncbi:MAG TPA: hypothetical protein VMZ28_21770 [Kofleriaceae bacterium]|nr:hypothetical protein [Kofleriaceae bacterium]
MKFLRMALALAPALAGCVRQPTHELDRPPPKPAAALTQPTRLCVTAAPHRPCRDAIDVEGWLLSPDLEIAGVDLTPTGIQGAQVLTLRVAGPQPVVFRAKWRAHSTTDGKNSPRRELAAHTVQKLFLSPREWVVPPSAPHCFPLDAYRAAVDPLAQATFSQAPCVYGVLQYWLENVQTLPDAEEAGWFDFTDDGMLDDELFDSSPVYRDAITAVNLVTYLIGHADSHWKQFLISKDKDLPITYSVDNSMSFDAKKNTRVHQDWSELRVPRLPRRQVERLRAASQDLGSLAAVAELTPQGSTLAVVPATANPGLYPNHGLEWVGGHLRVRLTSAEIASLRHRLYELLERIDRGEIAVVD